MSDWIAPIVSVVGALTSVGGFVFGVIKGSKELDKWRTERSATKRAEVAGEALVATIRFTDGLKQIASPFVVGSAPAEGEPEAVGERERETQDAEWLGAVLTERWEAFKPFATRFVDAWELAQVYLPDDVSELMREMWKARSAINATQNTYVMMLRQHHHEPKLYEGALGLHLEKELDELCERARKLLRPLAQLAPEHVSKAPSLPPVEAPRLHPKKRRKRSPSAG